MKSLVSNVPPPQSLLVIIKTVKDLADDLEMRLNQYSLNEKDCAILVLSRLTLSEYFLENLSN